MFRPHLIKNGALDFNKKSSILFKTEDFFSIDRDEKIYPNQTYLLERAVVIVREHSPGARPSGRSVSAATVLIGIFNVQ